MPAEPPPLGADVGRLRAEDAVVGQLLQGVGAPAGQAPDGEGGREEGGVEAEAVQQQRGVELDVGLQARAGLVLGQQGHRHALDVLGQGVQLAVAAGGVELGGGPLQHLGARVAHLVDAVAEAHQPLAAGEHGAHVGLGPLGAADREDHVEGRAGRAAVQRPLQRAEGAHQGREHVGLRGDDHARGEGGGVQAVVGDGDQVGLQGAGRRGRGPLAAEHPEVVGGVAEGAVGCERLLALQQAPVGGDDRRGGGHGALGLLQGRGGGRPGEAQAGRGHLQGVHGRVALGRGGAQQGERGRRQGAAGGEGGVERAQLGAVGQAGVPEQEDQLLEAGVGGQLLQREAGDGQLAAEAVDVAQARLGRHHSLQPRPQRGVREHIGAPPGGAPRPRRGRC
jgi:hypothetical protein